MPMEEWQEHRGTLMLVAKFPAAGTSKTRLSKAFGGAGGATVALAMLQDLLVRLASDDRLRDIALCVYFAPESRRLDMENLLHNLGDGYRQRWEVVPMDGLSTNLLSSDLGQILANGLLEGRRRSGGPVVFIGMDTPHLSVDWIVESVDRAVNGIAAIYPSTDGGYVLLALPESAPHQVFQGVAWSCEDTCRTQVSSIRDAGLAVFVGAPTTDIDDHADALLWHDAAHTADQQLRLLCPRTASTLEQLVQAIKLMGDTGIDGTPLATFFPSLPEEAAAPAKGRAWAFAPGRLLYAFAFSFGLAFGLAKDARGAALPLGDRF